MIWLLTVVEQKVEEVLSLIFSKLLHDTVSKSTSLEADLLGIAPAGAHLKLNAVESCGDHSSSISHNHSTSEHLDYLD